MSENVNMPRRGFLGAAAALAAAQQPVAGCRPRAVRRKQGPCLGRAGAQAAFAPIKHIHAGVLNVGGYAEAGPADGPVALLLHGWPYDIHSFAEVAPRLAARGYRVIVPARLWIDDLPVRRHHAQRPAIGHRRGHDCADGRAPYRGCRGGRLRLGRAHRRHHGRLVAGALQGLVSVSGYLIGSRAAGKQPLPPEAELQWWYQFYFATERGRASYQYTHQFAG